MKVFTLCCLYNFLIFPYSLRLASSLSVHYQLDCAVTLSGVVWLSKIAVCVALIQSSSCSMSYSVLSFPTVSLPAAVLYHTAAASFLLFPDRILILQPVSSWLVTIPPTISSRLVQSHTTTSGSNGVGSFSSMTQASNPPMSRVVNLRSFIDVLLLHVGLVATPSLF